MSGRVTQSVLEVLIQPNTQKARTTQSVLEVLIQPSTQKGRVTQSVIEVLVQEIVLPVGIFTSNVQLGARGTGGIYTGGNVQLVTVSTPLTVLERYSKHSDVDWTGPPEEWTADVASDDWLWTIWKLIPSTSFSDGRLRVTVYGISGSVDTIKLMMASLSDATAIPDLTYDTAGPGGLSEGQTQVLVGSYPRPYQEGYFAINVGESAPYIINAKITKIEWYEDGEWYEIWNPISGFIYTSGVGYE
ncbi:hypothetical protein LCGC14_0609650 [marine sediment metagenome]|uniref:Uncharacterized protein n=1 Tax=marine sediment metagenome TaxID=412755 RepID=A0A0F9UGH6_9ZZZZ